MLASAAPSCPCPIPKQSQRRSESLKRQHCANAAGAQNLVSRAGDPPSRNKHWVLSPIQFAGANGVGLDRAATGLCSARLCSFRGASGLSVAAGPERHAIGCRRAAGVGGWTDLSDRELCYRPGRRANGSGCRRSHARPVLPARVVGPRTSFHRSRGPVYRSSSPECLAHYEARARDQRGCRPASPDA